MTIMRQFLEEVRRSADRQAFADFCTGIDEIMAPFKSGYVRISVLHTPTYCRKLEVDIQNLGKFIFPLPWAFEGMDLTKDEVLSQLREIYREKYTEPDDHIQLGLE